MPQEKNKLIRWIVLFAIILLVGIGAKLALDKFLPIGFHAVIAPVEPSAGVEIFADSLRERVEQSQLMIGITAVGPETISLAGHLGPRSRWLLELILDEDVLGFFLIKDKQSSAIREELLEASPDLVLTSTQDGLCTNKKNGETLMRALNGLDTQLVWLTNASMKEPDAQQICVLPAVPIDLGADPLQEAIASIDSNGLPLVSLTLSETATTRFHVLTTENIGRRFSMAIGARIVMVELIRERITDGRMELSVGPYASQEEMLHEALALASVLTMGPMSGSGVIREFDSRSEKNE